MNDEKLAFLKSKFIPLLRTLSPETPAKWGLMNAQQMVEHFGDTVKNAAGKLELPIVNEGERLAKFREFMMSELPFKENTRNPLMSEEPLPTRLPDMKAAIDRLEKYLQIFFTEFETHPNLTTQNPFFGVLDYSGNVQLLHKHAMHHLRQFGLVN